VSEAARTIDLPRDARAVALARRAVEEHLRGLSDDAREAARLLVSELVTNAVRHGRGAIALSLDGDAEHVRVAVRDEGSGGLRRREHPSADGGFGLNLVEALASRWGIEEGAAHVWFELPREKAFARAAAAAPDGVERRQRPRPAHDPLQSPRRYGGGLRALPGALRSALAPPRWSGWAWSGGALALVLAALDIAVHELAILTALIVLAPLAMALLGRWADTAAVAALGVVLAMLASVWDGGVSSAEGIAMLVVAGGGLLAVIIAMLSAAAEVDLTRFRLLAAVADVGNEAADLDGAVARLLDILTPTFADIALLDTTLGNEQRRLGVRVSGPDAAQLEAALLERPPLPPDAPVGASRSIVRGRSQLVTDPDDRLLAAMAHDERDLELLRRLRLRAAIFVPLRARGRTIGALSALVGISGRGYSRADRRFAEVFAGRAAVVLDNAGLTRELSTAERQLDAVLDGLAEAVTVMDSRGRPVYANDAAVELLRLKDAREYLDAPPGTVMRRFAVYDEHGEPVELSRLPGFRVLAGERDPEPLLVRNIVRETGEERWLLNKTTTITDAQGRIVRVVNVIEDVTEAKRTEIAQRLLARASDVLASSLDYEQTLQRVAEAAVPSLADWCAVDLPGPGRAIRSVAIAHVDPEKVALARRFRERYPARQDGPELVPTVLREGTSQLMAQVHDEQLVAHAKDPEQLAMMRAIGLSSIIVVPLTAGGATLGALTLVRSDPLRRFGEADLALAEELGRRAGTAVLNARLYTERSAIAETLQQGLRPPDLREMPGFAAATLYRAAGELNEVGGDFYDLFHTDDGWMVVVGDVAGQGAEAATLTGLARYTLRSVGQLTGDPARAVCQLNETLRDQPQMSLCTAICAHVRRDGGDHATIAITNCGHPKPVRVRDGTVQELGEAGTMAGAFDGETWESASVELRVGDTLVLYTDGVLDTVGEHARFGEERLLATLRAGPADPQALVTHLAATLDAFRHGPQRDDTAVVALRFLGAEAPA
jgi:GAF domain-containing protein/anti-sigma regulatory factor (Ser/Thr protein kinase)